MYRFHLGKLPLAYCYDCTHPIITLFNVEEGVATAGRCERYTFC